MKPLVALALDVPDGASAVEYVRQTKERVDVFKVGLQLFCAEGPTVLDAVRSAGARAIFLDLKLHDIPNTVVGAIQSLRRCGVEYLTVHVDGGRTMLREAVKAAGADGPKLLGVTVLTSLDAPDLDELCVTASPAGVVLARARVARAAGVPGLVCSPNEVATLRAELGPEPFLVTPGIRLSPGGADDQRRVATPADAAAAGASMLVVGRAVTAASDPLAALDAIHAAMTGP